MTYVGGGGISQTVSRQLEGRSQRFRFCAMHLAAFIAGQVSKGGGINTEIGPYSKGWNKEFSKHIRILIVGFNCSGKGTDMLLRF
jgi:hypothetical protein